MLALHASAIQPAVTKATRAAFFLLLLSPSVSLTQIGLTGGTEYGFGITSRFGMQKVLLELGGGIAPLFVFNLTVSEDSKIYFPFTAGGKISIATTNEEDANRLGLKVGVSYNSIIRTGFGGGIDYQASRGPDVILGAGIMYYPDAQKGLTEKVNEDNRTNYTTVIAETIAIQPILSISIIFGK